MAKLQSAPTSKEFAKAWTAGFAAALKQEAPSGRISEAGARRLAKRDDALRVYGDNVSNYLAAEEQKTVSVEKLIGKGYRYAIAIGDKVAGEDGKISLVDARKMPADLVEDFYALRGKKLEGAPAGEQFFKSLKSVAADVTLGMFGEDDGSSCSALLRKGPIAKLDADTALKIFGFNLEKQKSSDVFEFQSVSKDDQEFWSLFMDTQFDAAAADQVKKLFTGKNVAEVASMVVADNTPFGTPVYLMARLDDGSVVSLRGMAGGMSF